MAFNKKQVEAFFIRANYDLEKGRETMDAMRSRLNKLQTQLVKNEHSDFQPYDDIHLATIVMAEEIQLRAFADVIENGVMCWADKEKKVKQKNHSISTFYQMSKMLNDTSRKLGLSALDRKELNIEKNINDEFDDENK